MRLIDADQLLDFIRFDERVIAPEEHTAQDIVMMIQTAPTIAPPPNDPLTLEQLREMDGEPVWVVGISTINNFRGHWDIFEWTDGKMMFCVSLEEPDIDNYDPKMKLGVAGWRAYCRKPEEGQHETAS